MDAAGKSHDTTYYEGAHGMGAVFKADSLKRYLDLYLIA